jgi:LPS export ABC transporter protein LptC
MRSGFLGSGFPRFAAIVVVALLVLDVAPIVRSAEPNRGGAGSPSISLRQVHMIETRDGSKLWEVRADQVEVNEREGFTVLTRVMRPIQIAFYSSQGQATCVADRATLDLTTKDVRLEGGVVARSEQGMELKTEQLRWIAASRRLQTDEAVTITRGGLVSRGRGLEAETDLERVRIFENITSQLRPVPAPAGRSRPR